MNELTYFLGAGASYYSMPLVETFVLRFKIFLQFIYDAKLISNKGEFVDDAKKFLEQVESHLSFDTYFKKLFHIKDDLAIYRGKKFLLTFFIYEHLSCLFPEDELESFIKKGVVDSRYDAFVGFPEVRPFKS